MVGNLLPDVGVGLLDYKVLFVFSLGWIPRNPFYLFSTCCCVVFLNNFMYELKRVSEGEGDAYKKETFC